MHFVHTSIIAFILTFSFFNQNLSQKKIVKVIEDDIYDKLLEIYRELKRSSQLNSLRPFLLAEVYFFQWKALILVETIFFLEETIPFSGNYSFQQKPFLLVEAIPFSGSHSLQWKLFFLVEAIHFNENHCPQWKVFLLAEAISFSGSYSFYENHSPSGSYSFQWKAFPLAGAVRFSGNSFL